MNRRKPNTRPRMRGPDNARRQNRSFHIQTPTTPSVADSSLFQKQGYLAPLRSSLERHTTNPAHRLGAVTILRSLSPDPALLHSKFRRKECPLIRTWWSQGHTFHSLAMEALCMLLFWTVATLETGTIRLMVRHGHLCLPAIWKHSSLRTVLLFPMALRQAFLIKDRDAKATTTGQDEEILGIRHAIPSRKHPQIPTSGYCQDVGDSSKTETVRPAESDEALDRFDHELILRLLVEKLGRPDGSHLEEKSFRRKRCVL